MYSTAAVYYILYFNIMYLYRNRVREVFIHQIYFLNRLKRKGLDGF